MSETILVTGAAGFAGSHLLVLLRRTAPDAELLAWRRPPGEGAPGGAAPPPRTLPADAVWRDVDLLDAAAVRRAVSARPPTQVYHCAGVANVDGSWAGRRTTLQGNVLGTGHLLAALRALPAPPRVLVTGSALVYRPSSAALAETAPLGPVSPYGASKLEQERLALAEVRDGGLPVVLTRSFTHIGPGQAPAYAAAGFAEQIARIEAGRAEPVLSVGDLEARRDLTDVRDTVRAYRMLMAGGTPGRPYNVCSGAAHRIGEVLDALLSLTRVPIAVRRDPARLRPADNPVLLGDRSRITAELGWEPRLPLSETLADLLGYWRGVVAGGTPPVRPLTRRRTRYKMRGWANKNRISSADTVARPCSTCRLRGRRRGSSRRGSRRAGPATRPAPPPCPPPSGAPTRRATRR